MSDTPKPADPVDALLKEADNQTRREKEHALWAQWNENGRKPEDLQPLMQAFKPLIVQKTKEWKPPMVPESAFHAEIQEHLIKAFETFNPARAALTTHVGSRVQKAKRYMGKYQNMAYIPPGKTRHIGRIQTAQNNLREDFGRDPTHEEIADYLGMPVKKITQVISAQRKDIPGSAWESDPFPQALSREHEVLGLLHLELSPDEREIYEYVLGINGKPRIDSTGDLAKKFGKSPSRISHLKTSIINKYKSFL